MKWMKRLGLLIAMLVLLLVIGLFYALNSPKMLNSALQTYIKQSGVDIKYDAIKGGVFSGLELKGFDYNSGDIKGDAKLAVDFKALKDGIVKIDELNISHLHLSQKFLKALTSSSGTKDQNSSTSIPIKEIKIKKAHLDLEDISYDGYRLERLNLDIKDFHSDLKRFWGGVRAEIKSSVADGAVRADLRGKSYSGDIDLTPRVAFLQPFMSDKNITLQTPPNLKAKLIGDFEKVQIQGEVSGGRIEKGELWVENETIPFDISYAINSKYIKAKIDSTLNSSIAKADTTLDSSLNLHDINRTLKYDINQTLVLSDNFSNKLKEQNITIQEAPIFKLSLIGDMKKANFQSTLVKGSVKVGEMEIKPKHLVLKGEFDIAEKNLSTTFDSNIDSDLANLTANGDLKADLNDINHTLFYHSKAQLKLGESFIASKIKDSNITLSSLSPIALVLKGDAKRLDALLSLSGEAKVDGIAFKPTIKDSKFHLDLQTKEFDSKLFATIDSGVGSVKADVDASGDLDDINATLRYSALLQAKRLKAFKGVDLSTFGDIEAKANGSLKRLQADIDSNLLQARLDSDDFKRFGFSVSTQRDIYIGKIYKKIDKSLIKSYIAFDGEGEYRLGDNSLELNAKLHRFYYNDRVFRSSRFKLLLDREGFTLSPLKISGGDFFANLSAKKEGEYIVATLQNQAINLRAKYKKEPLFVDAVGRVASIKALIKEVKKLYPIDTGVLNIDGSADFRAKMRGENVVLKVNSHAIKLDAGRLENFGIVAIYEPKSKPKRVRFKRFGFDMRGFGDKRMNKRVRLVREGIITFEEEDASVDIELENLAKFKALKKGENIDASLEAERLVLALKGYGKTTITSKLKVKKRGQKSWITGDINFQDTEINYKSRYLDISKDSDIIIISKDKKRSDSDFRDFTAMDLHITSSDEILYKVDDGEVEFKPDIKIKKRFGTMPVITGKIKVLGGFYDLADKRFKINEGAVAFRGQKEPNPLLDLHVEYDDLDEIDIFIDILGDKNRPRLKFSSKPMRSKKDIFSYLLFGMSASESEGAMSSANKAAERIFGRAVSKDLARELHLDRLDLTRNSDGGIDVKAGKKRDKKTIIYYQNRSTKSSIIVERKLSKDWEVDVEIGQDGHGVDFVYKRGFK